MRFEALSVGQLEEKHICWEADMIHLKFSRLRKRDAEWGMFRESSICPKWVSGDQEISNWVDENRYYA